MLPFGIISAAEYFQCCMSEILDRVVCHIDDVLVSGKDQAEHDDCLHMQFFKWLDSLLTEISVNFHVLQLLSLVML